MGLRKGQKELVENYRGGLCAVPAIPGGGKTHCLSIWAAEIIEKGINKPGEILIVTYMNSAVNNFKQRISSELKKRGIFSNKDYFVSTIHGLCLQIIKDKPDFLSASEEFEIIDDVTSQRILNSAIDEWRKNKEDVFISFLEETDMSSGKFEFARNKLRENFPYIVNSLIGEFKCRGININEAKEKTQNMTKSLLRAVVEIYGIYNKKLKMRGCIDFNDMLYSAKNILKSDKKILSKYREKFSFVCEDEAQDSNLIQNEILSLIANGNFLRVGDSNQAICGSFTSSDFKIFKEFCDNSNTTVYNITESSRNTTQIIDLANFFIRYVNDNHPIKECSNSLIPQFIEPVNQYDECRNPKINEYGIRVGVFNSLEDEKRRILNLAIDLTMKYPDKTIAILSPDSFKLNDMAEALRNREIMFEHLDNASKEKNITLIVLGKILKYISRPEDVEAFLDMIHGCFLLERYDSNLQDTEVISQRKVLNDYIRKCSLEKLIYPIDGEINIMQVPIELKQLKVWEDFLNCLDMVRDFLEFPDTVVEKLILYISERLNFGMEERAIAQKVASEVRNLMAENSNWRILDLAEELLKPKNKFNYFANVVWELKGYTPKPAVITLSTYHKAKGLEWDIVFLTGVNNSNFPVTLDDNFKGEYWYLKDEYKNPVAVAKADLKKVFDGKESVDSILESKLETVSERARLLYVGITRAKEYLYLSGVESKSKKKNSITLSKYLIEIKNFIREEEEKW